MQVAFKSIMLGKTFFKRQKVFPKPFSKIRSQFAQMLSATAFKHIAKAFRKRVCPDQSGLALEKGFPQKGISLDRFRKGLIEYNFVLIAHCVQF